MLKQIYYSSPPVQTSRYMRYKMKIDNNHQGLKCPLGTIETLKHFHLECPANQAFFQKVTEFAMGYIDEEFSNSNINQFALNHDIAAVNFIFLVAYWYVGRKTQQKLSIEFKIDRQTVNCYRSRIKWLPY